MSRVQYTIFVPETSGLGQPTPGNSGLGSVRHAERALKLGRIPAISRDTESMLWVFQVDSLGAPVGTAESSNGDKKWQSVFSRLSEEFQLRSMCFVQYEFLGTNVR